jgi:hypothetical protein
MLRVIIFFAITLFCIGCGDEEERKVPTYDRVYTPNAALNLQNPNRGLYKHVAPLNLQTDYDRFQIAKDEGYQLVYAALKLYTYTQTTTLEDTLLQTLQNNLQSATDAGVRIIFRVQYRDGNGSDPSKDIILAHLQQLKPILSSYKDTIAGVEAGCIGAYGEWHSFSGDFNETDSNYIQNRKDIIAALADIFRDKFIQIRTPMHKELLYGSSNTYGESSKCKNYPFTCIFQ